MQASDGQAEIEAIKRLKARYFRCMDTKNWKEWRKVFTDDVDVRVDVTVSTGGKKAVTPPLPKGGDAFVAYMSKYLAGISTVHHGHMPEITLTGKDTAAGIWSMEDIVGFPDGQTMKGYGHYHEQYCKQDGEWRIATLHITRLRLDYTGPWPKTEEEMMAMMEIYTPEEA